MYYELRVDMEKERIRPRWLLEFLGEYYSIAG